MNRPPDRARAAGTRAARSRELRIIAGQWRGRRWRFPEGPDIRPTPDRVRETLFNWLAPHIHGARVLDLFAGSGALGLEALSRGAASAGAGGADGGGATSGVAAARHAQVARAVHIFRRR
mgnify:CR=1 FL=1